MGEKNILIFYEHINREYKSCLRLKKELEEVGGDCRVYLVSIMFEYAKALKINKKIKIDMVIMPWIYFNGDYRYVQPFIEQNKDIYIANFHHEQIGSQFAENFMLPSCEDSKNSVIHFVWGEYFKEKLISVGVKENLIFITGNIRTDKSSKTVKSKLDLSKEFDLDFNKKWILFSENRTWVLTSTKESMQHRINLGFEQEGLIEREILLKESIGLSLKEFKEIKDDFFEKYELIYRAHPGTIVPENIDSRVKVIEDYPIYTWLNVIDANVVWSSTSIFESDLMCVPSFVYEPIKHTSKYKTYGLEHYQTINMFEEIDDELIKYYQDNIKPKKIYEKFMGLCDGKSVYRMKKIIIDILFNGIYNYKANKVEYSKEAVSRIKKRDNITYLLVKLKLFDILKHPQKSYKYKEEIPYRNKRLEKISNIE